MRFVYQPLPMTPELQAIQDAALGLGALMVRAQNVGVEINLYNGIGERPADCMTEDEALRLIEAREAILAKLRDSIAGGAQDNHGTSEKI